MGLTIKCFPFGIQDENTYLVTDETTGFKAVIDPGYFGEDVRAEVGDNDSLKYILLTHGHFDHFAAAQEYIDKYPEAVFAVPAGEEYILHGGRDNKWMALGRGDGVCPDSDVKLKEGDVISLGETDLKVMETPGHTEGGIVFYTDKDAFTGDTLFRSSVGNSILETSSKAALVSSIQDKLYSLNDDTVIRPGHGESSTIGFEKKFNPFVPERNRVLTVPEGTKTIGNRQFSGRSDIEEVQIPDSVCNIGVAAFCDCTSLERIKLPAGLNRIMKELFSGCSSLQEISIPQGVATIGEWAFRNCGALRYVRIPASVREIAAEAFLLCPYLNIVTEQGSYAEEFARKNGFKIIYTDEC